jgi:hypothetical protein
MIRIEKTTSITFSSSYHFYFNNVYLGDAEMDESGFYNFWFAKDNGGYWTSHSLRLIAEKLDELNKEWNDNILKNLK